MVRVTIVVQLALTIAALMASAAPARRSGVDWPQFRGPNASGLAEGYPTPTTWEVEAKHNLLWKTPIPGLGHSSPTIWGDRLFVTTAISGNAQAELKVGLYGDVTPVNDDTVHRWLALCLDKKTGRIVWQQTAHSGVPRIKRHTKATHANSTMATDGRHVVAFLGSEGLFCYDFAGKLLWKKDFGPLDAGWYFMPGAQWGFGSSPVIHNGVVFIQCDVQKGSFVAALDVKDGRELWRTPRNEVPTWGTPTVLGSGESAQVVVNGYKHIGAYHARTGAELWKLKGGGDIPVPTPVAGHGLVFITNAHGLMAPIYAIKTTATGDISLKPEETRNDHIAWMTPRDGGYMQTPLVVGDYLYVCRDNGVLSCYNAKTGERLYQERLSPGRTGYTASGVAALAGPADGKLYYTSEVGEVHVLRAGPRFEILATNQLGEVCLTTPAISEGKLFFRTQRHVVAIGERR